MGGRWVVRGACSTGGAGGLLRETTHQPVDGRVVQRQAAPHVLKQPPVHHGGRGKVEEVFTAGRIAAVARGAPAHEPLIHVHCIVGPIVARDLRALLLLGKAKGVE